MRPTQHGRGAGSGSLTLAVRIEPIAACGPMIPGRYEAPPVSSGIVPGVTEQPAPPPRGPDLAEPTGAATPTTPDHPGAVPESPRRQPGEPHPYMLQRNPPNLWILVALTIFSLALTALILALTVLL